MFVAFFSVQKKKTVRTCPVCTCVCVILVLLQVVGIGFGLIRSCLLLCYDRNSSEQSAAIKYCTVQSKRISVTEYTKLESSDSKPADEVSVCHIQCIT